VIQYLIVKGDVKARGRRDEFAGLGDDVEDCEALSPRLFCV
jgi:hypothetical protein